MRTDYNTEDILGNVKHPICPISCYFKGGEDKCDTTKCDWSTEIRSCTGACKILETVTVLGHKIPIIGTVGGGGKVTFFNKGDTNMAGDKYDEGKNRLGLIPPEIIEAVGRILTHGAIKYAPRNWQKGISYEKIYGAMQRHLQKFWNGEKLDSESGLPHLDHAACNLAFLITYEAHSEYKEFDDRYLYNKSDSEFVGYKIAESLRFGWYVYINDTYLCKDLKFYKNTRYTSNISGYYPTKEIAEAYLRAYLDRK